MGTPFPDNINAGNNLIIPSLQSPNFVHGVSGWSINKDGSAEFNNGVFRGVITAGGIFFYTGTPGLGNLPIFSVCPPGTTQDPFGNGVVPTVTIGQLSGGHWHWDSSGNLDINNNSSQLIATFRPADQALLFYKPGGGAGNLLVSLASAAGTDQYGNAYAQGLNVTAGVISGATFSGADFIINSSGLFFYSGTPAIGNLVASYAPVGGTDPFGNNYVGPGFVSYDGTGAWAKLSTASLLFQTSDFAQLTPQGITYQVIGSGTGRQIAIRLKSPAYVAGQDATLFLESASADSGATSGATIIGSLGQGGSFQLGLDNSGNPEFILGTNTPLKATQPGGSNAETWHTISGAAGLSGAFRVKFLPWNAVWFDGEGAFTYGASAQTFTLGNLPSASYYPTATRHLPTAITGGVTGAATNLPRLFIATSGGPQVIVPAGSGTGNVGWSVIYPTD